MNTVALIGNLTRDPEVRYTNSKMAIASFAIAINRPPKEDGTKEADYPRITVFGKQAENCERFLKRGSKVGIVGRIQTGSYEKNGQRIYTTDVVADRVEFLSRPQEANAAQDQNVVNFQNRQATNTAPAPTPATNAWEAVDDDDIPF